MKPIVRELPKTGDQNRWLITYKGVTKVAVVSSCQMAANPSLLSAEMEYQISKRITEIERESK